MQRNQFPLAECQDVIHTWVLGLDLKLVLYSFYNTLSLLRLRFLIPFRSITRSVALHRLLTHPENQFNQIVTGFQTQSPNFTSVWICLNDFILDFLLEIQPAICISDKCLLKKQQLNLTRFLVSALRFGAEVLSTGHFTTSSTVAFIGGISLKMQRYDALRGSLFVQDLLANKNRLRKKSIYN